MKITKKMSLYQRFLLIFISSILLVAVLIGGYMSMNIYTLSVNNIYQNMELLMQQTNQNLTQYFKLVSNVSTSLAASDSVDNWIDKNNYFSEDNSNYYINVQALHKEFENILSYNSIWTLKLFDYAILYSDNKPINYTYTTSKSIKELKVIADYAYYKMQKNDDIFLQNIAPSLDVPIMFYTRKVKSQFKGNKELTIIIAIEEKNISNRFAAMTSIEGSKVLLLDENNNIFSSNDKTLLGCNLNENIKFDYDKYNLIYEKVEDTDFYLAYLIPKAYVFKTAFLGVRTLIEMLMILIIGVVTLSTVIATRSTVFIKDFSYAMNRVKGKDYTIRMHKYNDKAIDNMVDSFNEMVDQIERLIHTTYESQLLLKDMQIKFMQHQMNPHFLFNMLLTIEINAKMSGNEKLYNMINRLSSLLRAGIYSDKKPFVTLDEELKYVELYLSLQQTRFEDRFEYTIDIEEQLKDYIIPRLSIEPIVENAMIHGIENIVEKGEIYISVKEKKEDIEIEIKDNGIGFDIYKILDKETKEFYSEVDGRESVGLKNTDKRIKLIYGKRYGLDINSQKGMGTTINMLIPKERERDV